MILDKHDEIDFGINVNRGRDRDRDRDRDHNRGRDRDGNRSRDADCRGGNCSPVSASGESSTSLFNF